MKWLKRIIKNLIEKDKEISRKLKHERFKKLLLTRYGIPYEDYCKMSEMERLRVCRDLASY